MASAKTSVPPQSAAGGPKAKPAKKRVKKNVATGIACIQSTFNNTIVTITDVNGNAVSWSSAGAPGRAGRAGRRGARSRTCPCSSGPP